MVEISEWDVVVSGHLLDLGVHDMSLLSLLGQRFENGGRGWDFFDVDVVSDGRWRYLDLVGRGAVVYGECLIRCQGRVNVFEASR